MTARRRFGKTVRRGSAPSIPIEPKHEMPLEAAEVAAH